MVDWFYPPLQNAIENVLQNFVEGVAELLIVLIFLLIGYIVSKFLIHILDKFLEYFKLEERLEEKGVHDALAGFTLTHILSIIVKLLTVSVFLGIAASVTNLTFLGNLVWWFIGYVPLLVQGIVVLVLALLAGDYVTDRIKQAKIPFSRFIALVTEVFIAYTAIVVALPLVLPNVNVEVLKTAFTLVLGAFAVALGLGFAIAIGFGLKDTVADVAKSKRKDIEKMF